MFRKIIWFNWWRTSCRRSLDGQTIRGESIAYDNVTFSYPNRKEKIFDTASVNIKKGDKIALIGESGIGKSTFVKLMMRFWDVNEGKINLDNKNINEVNTASLRIVKL